MPMPLCRVARQRHTMEAMSSTSPRPKSTLALDRFAATQRPLGAPEPRRGGRPETPSVMGVGRTGAGGRAPESTRLAPSLPMRTRPAPAAATATPWVTTVKGAARQAADEPLPPRRVASDQRHEAERKDRVIVTSLIVACILLLLAMGTLRVRSSMRDGASEKALGATFGVVHTRQGQFRLLNRRFATWRELESSGARLGPRQRVVASNASASHWFLSVEDTGTGITCSRTGELFDEGPAARRPSCTASRR